MLAARAAQRYVEARFPFFLVEGDQELHHAEQLLQESLAFLPPHDVVLNLLILPGEVLQLLDEIGIGQEAHVQHEIRLGGKPVPVAEGHEIDHEPLLRRGGHDVPLDDLLELMDVERRGVDDLVGHLPQSRELFPFQGDPFHDGPAFAQGVRAPGFLKTPQERVVTGIEKENLDPVPLLFERGEDLRVFFQEIALPQVHHQRDLADLAGRVGLHLEEFGQERHGKVVHAEEAHILQGAKGRALAGAGHAGDDHDSQVLHASPPGAGSRRRRPVSAGSGRERIRGGAGRDRYGAFRGIRSIA